MEHNVEERIFKAMQRAGMDPVKVDNPRGPGTPDLNYIDGWIEVKYLSKWPSSKDAVVKIPHFTTRQKIWLFRRHMSGGRAHLFLRVGAMDYLLIPGNQVQYVGSEMTRAEMIDACDLYWHGNFKERELIECLTR